MHVVTGIQHSSVHPQRPMAIQMGELFEEQAWLDGNGCDVQKRSTKRLAVASGRVLLGRNAFELVAANAIKKGDVLKVAQARDFVLRVYPYAPNMWPV